jgi:hypothetical protein
MARTDDGTLALAYSESVGSVHRLAYMYREGSTWIAFGDPTSFDAPILDRVWLDHSMGSARSPRLIWTEHEAGGLRLYYGENAFVGGTWRVTDLGEVQQPIANLAFHADGIPHIAYADVGRMRIARKVELINSETVGPTLPTSPGALSFCLCVLQFFGNNIDCFSGEVEQGANRTSSASAGFGTTFRRVRQRFTTTPAGRYYTDLYQRFGPEILALTFADRGLHELHLRTLEDFKPALTAFAEGNASAYVLSPRMLDSARQVWEGWAQRGSPELAAAIQFELGRSNNLQSYANLNFEQWFQSLQTGPGAMLADGFE